MKTTRVIFNTGKQLKERAKKRAYAEGSDLTTILNQAMALYVSGDFDPDDFLTKEDLAALKHSLADVKAGRVYTQEEVFARLDL